MKYSSSDSEKNLFWKWVKRLWIIIGSAVGIVVLLIIFISLGVFGKLPDTLKLENPESPLATEIYASDGYLLGKFFNENRSTVVYNDISKHVFNSLIATEDVRFKKHSGIDIRGLYAIPASLLVGKKRGASTISQQLAKNLFPRESFKTLPQIVIRKLKEWVLAVKLERLYTKEEIITMYLNTVDFGSNAFGIKSAARTYFNKFPDSLNIQESATLIGLLKGTRKFSPFYNPESSKSRRNVVLRQMKKYGFIEREEYDSIIKLPIKLDYQVESHNQGLARYFREHLRMELSDWCKENGYDLYSSGLKIYTTIDSKMQRYAEEACKQHLVEMQKLFFDQWKGVKNAPFGHELKVEDVKKVMVQAIKRTDRYRILKSAGKSWDEIWVNFNTKRKMKIFSYEKEYESNISPYDSIYYYKYYLNPGFMAMEPSTGQVKAWVGGVDFKYFKYDHVTSSRQVGSTFKPFVYTVAIVNGYSPCMEVPNVPVVFPDFQNWKPVNSDGKYGGIMTLKSGLSKSINCITAWVMKQVGPQSVVDLVGKMGIDTTNIDAFPSICLGTPDISVFEMVGAFNTYANKGIWVEPTIITRIEDKDGNVIRDYRPREVEILDEKYNYVMVNMLQSVTSGGGTGVRLRYKYKVNMPAGGKTGTTQNNSDAWYIGFTPELTAGCWVGCEDRSVHFRSMQYGQGASLALPIYAYFMQKVLADSSLGIKGIEFPKPEGDLPVEINCARYKDDDKEAFD